MTREIWKPVQRRVCERIGEEVALEIRVVYPASFMPDQPARVLAHRCSMGLVCSCEDRPSCHWAGSVPGYDPFA